MKTIKSVLIGALVALLGSSAWAATYDVNLQIGGVTNIQFATTTSNPSWAIGTAGDESVATFTLGGTRNREATITGVGVGSTTWTVSRSGTTHTFNVRVTEPSFVDYGTNEVTLAANASEEYTVKSAAAAEWTFWSEDPTVATVSPSASDGATAKASFTIKALTKETATYCVASNKYAKYTYKVNVDTHNGVINFTREYYYANKRRAAPAVTNWKAWADDPDMVTVTLERDRNHDESGTSVTPGAGSEDDPYKFHGQYVNLLITNKLTKSGVTYVRMTNEAEGPDHPYVFKVICDVATCRSITLKHSPDGTDPQSWYDIDPEEFPGLKPISGDEAPWGLGHAYSDNTNIARIAVVDVGGEKRFRIYNPTGDEGRDGETRVVFIPSEEDALAGGKIWIFYVSVSTVEVEKFLTFKDESKKDSEATLNIRTHYLNNMTEEYTNKVLFVGTGCSSHDLEKDTLIDSVYVIAQKANVDVYMPSPTDTGTSILGKKIAITKGLSKEQVSTALNLGSGDFPSNNHSTMEGFYGLFYQLAMDEKMRYYYDYIVMEFDCQRIAAYKNSGGQDAYVFDKTRDTVVAEWLNEYYEGTKNSPTARVVWVVDDEIGANGGSGYLRNESEENFFRPFQRHITGSGSTENNTETSGISDNRFRALLGLLNPWLYLEYDLYAATDAADLADRLDSCCGTYDYRIGANDPGTLCEDTRIGEKYKWQAYYNNKDGLKDFLANHFETTTYAAQITDNVETQGLSIVEGTLKMYGAYETNTVGNTDIENWTEIKATAQSGMSVTGSVDCPDHSITGVTENIVREFWTWITVDLKDDANGSFRLGATLVPGANKSSRDPNLNTNIVDGVYADTTNGEAAVAYFYDTLKPDDGVYGWATTLWDWEFEANPIDLKTFGVKRMYDGTPTNATYTVEPSDATIKVAYSVDKTNWTDPEDWSASKFTDCTNVWVRFVASRDGFVTQTNELSQVVITQRLVVVTAQNASKVYDGTPLTQPGYDVSTSEGDGFVFGEGYSSLSMTGDSTITNVGSTNNVVNGGSAAFKSNTNPGNYRFDYRKGSLAVTARPIVPGEPSDPPGSDTDLAYATGVEKFYDGQPSTITVDVKGKVKTTGATVTKKYFDHAPANDAEPGVDALSFTNFTDGAKWIWCRVTAGDNFIGCVVSNTVTIKKRTVTVTAGSKSKQYDGNPLTCSTYTVTPFASPNYGFVSGEGFDSVVMTADSKITEVGSTNNVIDKVESQLKTNTNPANYNIAYVDGRLTVYSVPPPPPPKHEQEWLYPDGDGCQTIDGSKVQNYMGTIISSNAADGVVGTIEVKTSRANRNGMIKIKAAVRLRKSGKKVNYDCNNVVIDTKACSQTVNMAKACCKKGLPPRLILTFNGNSMTGGYDQDCFIDGAINVFADKKDPRRAALDPYAGTWNGVFALDGDMPGDALFSVTIQRNTGKVSSKCLMPDGLEYSWSTVAQIGANDFCVVPLAFSKSALGVIRSLGARMTFDPTVPVDRIRNISDWQVCNKNAQVLSTVGKVGEYTFCRTAMSNGDFSDLTPVVIDAPEWLPLEADKVAFKFNAQTGKITGKMTWVVIGETGKKKTYVGKVQGYAVGSECIGNVTISKVGTFQIVFVKPAK